MTMKTRHWGLLSLAAVNVAAMAFGVPLEQLNIVNAAIISIVIGDKINSIVRSKTQD